VRDVPSSDLGIETLLRPANGATPHRGRSLRVTWCEGDPPVPQGEPISGGALRRHKTSQPP
jgi:hypothetical protein